MNTGFYFSRRVLSIISPCMPLRLSSCDILRNMLKLTVEDFINIAEQYGTIEYHKAYPNDLNYAFLLVDYKNQKACVEQFNSLLVLNKLRGIA